MSVTLIGRLMSRDGLGQLEVRRPPGRLAQTRAISRALQAPLRHIAVLAGFQGAAAEEMPVIDATPADVDTSPASKIPDPIKPTADQTDELNLLIRSLNVRRPDVDWIARAREIAGVPGDMLTRTTMQILLGKLEHELEEAP